METAEHWAEAVLEPASFVIELVAAGILLFGAARFGVIIVLEGVRRSDSFSRVLQAARLKLGVYILAGLEFLVVADILFTIVNRTLDDLVNLAIVASVRTVISYFLGREIEALEGEEDEKMREELRPAPPP